MDKIKTTDCYVPVDVKDRLPQKNGYYITCVEAQKENKLIHYRTDTGWRNEIDTVTHWLEKKEGVIVLTEAEYLADKTKTAEEAFLAGQKFEYGILKYRETSEPDKEAYIKNLLP